MFPIEHILFIVAILLFLSVLASKASDRSGVPALLLFLVIGMLAGSEGLGGIYFDDPWLAKSVGVVALIFILFSGGLDTEWRDIRHVLAPGITLATLGVILTAFLVGLFTTIVLKFSLLEGMLLGAIVSSTDAAAVFNVLRSRQVSLRGKLRPLLELESGSNDPMAVFLTVNLIRWLILVHEKSLTGLNFLPAILLDLGLGAAIGYVMGRLMVWLINSLKLSYEGLYPVLMIALVLLTYAFATLAQGNGFLAVYLAAILMGNSNFIHKKTLHRFHEGLAWLMQIVMFLALGLLVFPSQLVGVSGVGLLIAVFLMIVARPVSVFLCLVATKMNIREKFMVAWVGLRGAVPIILATFPLLAGLPKANTIFNIVFFIVLTSILLQGTTVPWISRLLGVDAPFRNKRYHPIEFEHTGNVDAELTDFIVPYESDMIGKPLIHMGIPSGCLIVLICRDEKYFIPNGATLLQSGDVLLVLATQQDLKKLKTLFSERKAEELGE